MTTLRETLVAKTASLLTPIPGAQAAGADPTFDPDFERIKLEIDKLASIDAREPAWSEIRDLGVNLLTTRAKDLRVMGWVGAAQTKLDGWKGFAEALIGYDALARAFWDTMFPEVRRPRGRVNSFGWFTELTAKHLQALEVSFADGEAVRTCDEVLRLLSQFLTEKLGEGYGGPGPLLRLMREKIAAVPEAAAAPPEGSASPTASAPSPAQQTARAEAPPPAPSTAAPGDVDAAVQESIQALLRAAQAVRAADATQPQAYRLQRWGAWAAIQNPPPTDGDRTRIRPPQDALLRRLTLLRDSQKWREVLNAAEEATGTYLLWLDLHRTVATALERLGDSYASAREVVGREVIAFVTRFPTIPSLAFSNGTPFADAGTKGWLEEETRRWSGTTASAASSVASAEDEEVAKRFADAETLVTAGQIAEGLAMGVALARRGADARTRFRAGLAVGKMALKGSRPDVARAILESLAVQAEHHDLEVWEPALCATLYTYLLSAAREGIRPKPLPPDVASREQALFDKLCRLDPATALKFALG